MDESNAKFENVQAMLLLGVFDLCWFYCVAFGFIVLLLVLLCCFWFYCVAFGFIVLLSFIRYAYKCTHAAWVLFVSINKILIVIALESCVI
jgi:hypothetical protein